MKALLPVFCRPLGYIILAISIFLPFLMVMWDMVNDNNLLFYKECVKLLMILGSLMILMALSKNESAETERLRVKAIRNAVFITVIFIFANMLYRVAVGNINSVDSSSFLTFLIINILCLEFEMKRAMLNSLFKR